MERSEHPTNWPTTQSRPLRFNAQLSGRVIRNRHPNDLNKRSRACRAQIAVVIRIAKQHKTGAKAIEYAINSSMQFTRHFRYAVFDTTTERTRRVAKVNKVAAKSPKSLPKISNRGIAFDEEYSSSAALETGESCNAASIPAIDPTNSKHFLNVEFGLLRPFTINVPVKTSIAINQHIKTPRRGIGKNAIAKHTRAVPTNTCDIEYLMKLSLDNARANLGDLKM